jgi:UDP-3-O-[3-hydroxymyristoyl] N-acetylglucosamine deacetylase
MCFYKKTRMKTAEQQEMNIQRTHATVKGPITLTGRGLHSGSDATLRITPAEPGTGLIFTVGKRGAVKVSPMTVVDTVHAVTIGNEDVSVQTVEHLLAALYAAGITDAILELSGSEIPILDGSAYPFYQAIQSAGTQKSAIPVEPIRLANPVWVVEGDKYLIALPENGLRITYSIDYNHPGLKGQSIVVDCENGDFADDFLPARTFGFMTDIEMLQAKGLIRGGSIENAVVLTANGYMNELRFENECIRHKVLDLVGDLYLLGRPLNAHIIASKAGHTLDAALAKKIAMRIALDEVATKRRSPSRADLNILSH